MDGLGAVLCSGTAQPTSIGADIDRKRHLRLCQMRSVIQSIGSHGIRVPVVDDVPVALVSSGLYSKYSLSRCEQSSGRHLYRGLEIVALWSSPFSIKTFPAFPIPFASAHSLHGSRVLIDTFNPLDFTLSSFARSPA